jgi:serine/threonine-protein kinase
MADHPGIQERTRREARALSASRSPHLVEIYDFGEDPSYLAMELLGGGTLGALIVNAPIGRGGCLGPARTVRLGRELLQALEVIHGQDLLHRDIKPGNVLFRLPRREAVLGDLGLVAASDRGPRPGRRQRPAPARPDGHGSPRRDPRVHPPGGLARGELERAG